MPWDKEIQRKMKLSHDDIESLEEGRTLWTFESAMYLEEEENEATGS